jgi:hypothetical protein
MAICGGPALVGRAILPAVGFQPAPPPHQFRKEQIMAPLAHPPDRPPLVGRAILPGAGFPAGPAAWKGGGSQDWLPHATELPHHPRILKGAKRWHY